MRVLTAFYLIKFQDKNKEKIKILILNFIESFEKIVIPENMWFFALFISNISNIFFKNKLIHEAIPLKK